MGDKILLNFSITKLEDMIEKGNVWYSIHYRQYFDKYVCLYLMGNRAAPLERDGVHLVPVGTGRPLYDLLMAPLRVYRGAKAFGATHFLTADLVLAWWHSSLLRLLTAAPVMVMPVCNPAEILRTSGKSYSGLPAWVERLFINLSFIGAHKILCVKTDRSGVAWVRSTGFERKLKIVDVLPEEFSAPEFMERLNGCRDDDGNGRRSNPQVQLVFVGRLEKEKLVDDLMDAIIRLDQLRKPFFLTIIGDGTARPELERRARAAGLSDRIAFTGFLPSGEVAKYLSRSDIFVSPYTGTSLREAAAAGLAIVAYRLGGIEDLFADEENCLLAEPHDSKAMADQIARLIDNPGQRPELGGKARLLAQTVWSTRALQLSLREAFEHDV
ncbi:MAG TPA: glycosyltransferase [Vicinamibacterales bacterium]|jgi:glycosyltransferase involved in cell wall biosynthesis